MKLQKLDLLNQNEVTFMENLYIDSFPKEERRPSDRMFKAYEEKNNNFFILLAVEDNKNVGFFTYWDLGEFIFAEHFAISPDFRSGGYGSQVMNLFMEGISKPIILEVDPPESEIAERRVVFYERLGFKYWADVKYRQPSYLQDGKSYPMKLMSTNDVDLATNGKEFIDMIHKIPYTV